MMLHTRTARAAGHTDVSRKGTPLRQLADGKLSLKVQRDFHMTTALSSGDRTLGKNNSLGAGDSQVTTQESALSSSAGQ